MKANSNLIQDILCHYKERLVYCFSESEALSLLYTLMDHFFNISKLDLVKQPTLRLSESEMLKIHFAVKDLLKHKPIQYITGKVEFLDLELQIKEGILIPRPETEQLVQLILDDLVSVNKNLSVLDIGTGSGCISLALKHHQSTLNVIGIDLSEKAIELARINANSHQIGVKFVQMDVFNETKVQSLGKFEIIVSNPPYVRDCERKQMRKNVLDFEPELALFVRDDDPLRYYKCIAQLGRQMLSDKGALYFEINESLATDIVELLHKYDYQNIQVKMDFNDRSRFVCAFK